MKHARPFLLTLSIVVMFVAVPAVADWDEGDPYKMLNPQLPDPNGWDVFAGTNFDGTQKVLADDWLCTETGPVSDVHIWGSWRWDEGTSVPGAITGIYLSIHDDVPADQTNPYSHPGNLLWDRFFDPTQFTVRDYGTGEQGWYNPNTGEYNRFDHQLYHQININPIEDPFIQEEGTIYWLDVSVVTIDPFLEWGWKTTQDHWNDDAVWSDFDISIGDGISGWQELRDPITGESLDMAFVITPEPGTMLLLGLGGTALIFRRTKRKEKRYLKESL